MTKDKALHRWFSGFGMTAYAASSVPEDAVLPYLTYELITGAWEGGEVSLSVDLWFYTTSEAVPNAKAQKLSEAVGLGGVVLPCDGGAIWLKRGSPWCRSLWDETDGNLKRRRINISAEYMTIN